MIYWRDDFDLQECRFCGHPRYKPSLHRTVKKKKVPWNRMYYFPLTPRLQRLYASVETAKHMRWHSEHVQDGDTMCHPSDSPAWKHFDTTHPDFALEVRNVRLGLSADGFQPFGQSGQQYSSWPVILTPYNLPPWMCMKDEYMFLTVIAPGPSNPKNKLDVFLQPLIAELNELWSVGAKTYDVHVKTNFTMRASLLWTISDFPAYAMLSGWSTAGKLACPYCMENSDAFTLPNGGKTSWFDNHRKFLPMDHNFRRNIKWFKKYHQVKKPPPHIKSGDEIIEELESYGFRSVIEPVAIEVNSEIVRRCKCGWRKRSIFWELPYWRTNMIRHNLDVMHIEKNVFENIFNTILNFPGRTKDNAKSREDLKEFCNRPELHRDDISNTYPKACYTLDKHSKVVLCNWLRNLKFSDGYASKMSRCVDMAKLKMFGMKSHDCHVFMQRLIPIAFKELLPHNVWQALTELSLFFKDITSRSIRCSDMVRMENDIPVILCKLERIFPPSFFDCMEHLPVHLAYEARIAGPVQYRWMYPFERFLRRLKNNVRNKARVEGSISNAYLVEEASYFCTHYFSASVKTRLRKQSRNDEGDNAQAGDVSNVSIFNFNGRPMGASKFRRLDDTEYHAARTYILLNCEEVKPYVSIFETELQLNNQSINSREMDLRLQTEFALWFEQYVQQPGANIPDKCLENIAFGPLRKIKSYSGYFVSGFRFHTVRHGATRSTSNSGVTVKGSGNTNNEINYYGNIEEIIEVEYPGLPIKRIVLFKCAWFDPTPKTGTRHHPKYQLFDVKKNKRLHIYEPFIFAVQAAQVVYVTYPNVKRSTDEWLAVCKMQPRSFIQAPIPNVVSSIDNEAFQNEEIGQHIIDVEDITISHVLTDVEILYEEIDELDEFDENELEIFVSSGGDDSENDDAYSNDDV
ncbi:uncharacterized protein [Primulina eburnea]|uniref:uncharacterized protein isoform X1 n=1 Tax=Primulina eburnea TaxID=1245227 RepID=UPI003C6CACEB